MIEILAPMAIGAIGGALTNKKKPLNGALLGAGLGAGAGAMAPALSGLLGGGASGGAAAALPWADGAGAIVAPGAAEAAQAAATPGVMDGLLATTKKYMPLANAASTGLSMSGVMGGGEQPMQAPEVQQAQGGAQTMAHLAGNGSAQQAMQADAQGRARRRAQRGFV